MSTGFGETRVRISPQLLSHLFCRVSNVVIQIAPIIESGYPPSPTDLEQIFEHVGSLLHDVVVINQGPFGQPAFLVDVEDVPIHFSSNSTVALPDADFGTGDALPVGDHVTSVLEPHQESEVEVDNRSDTSESAVCNDSLTSLPPPPRPIHRVTSQLSPTPAPPPSPSSPKPVNNVTLVGTSGVADDEGELRFVTSNFCCWYCGVVNNAVVQST